MPHLLCTLKICYSSYFYHVFIQVSICFTDLLGMKFLFWEDINIAFYCFMSLRNTRDCGIFFFPIVISYCLLSRTVIFLAWIIKIDLIPWGLEGKLLYFNVAPKAQNAMLINMNWKFDPICLTNTSGSALSMAGCLEEAFGIGHNPTSTPRIEGGKKRRGNWRGKH